MIHYAVQGGSIDVIRILLKKKKELLEIPNAFGLTPLSVACDDEQIEIIKFLVEHNADFTDTIPHYIRKNEPKIVRILLKYGEIQNKKNTYHEQKRNPLHIAIKYNRVRITKIILRYSPILSTWKDEHGRKPTDLLRTTSNAGIKMLFSKSKSKTS